MANKPKILLIGIIKYTQLFSQEFRKGEQRTDRKFIKHVTRW